MSKVEDKYFLKIKIYIKIILIFFLKSIISHVLISIPSILFFKIFYSIYSLNTICGKDSNNSSSLTNLFLNGFIAASLSLFILTICALWMLLLFGLCII